jgi:hypothetical protein
VIGAPVWCDTVGVNVGDTLGPEVGLVVGFFDGESVGDAVGDTVGVPVGAFDGVYVASSQKHSISGAQTAELCVIQWLYKKTLLMLSTKHPAGRNSVVMYLSLMSIPDASAIAAQSSYFVIG